MTEDSNAARRPSIATIFNPRKAKPQPTTIKPPTNNSTTHLRPSVVVTDEDNLTNGNDLLQQDALLQQEARSTSITGLQALPRDRSSTVTDRGVGGRSIASRASSGSLNISGTSNRIARHVRSPSVNLTHSVTVQNDNEMGTSRPGSERTHHSLCYRLGSALISATARKMVAGVFVTVFVSASWVGATHLIKDLFLRQVPLNPPTNISNSSFLDPTATTFLTAKPSGISLRKYTKNPPLTSKPLALSLLSAASTANNNNNPTTHNKADSISLLSSSTLEAIPSKLTTPRGDVQQTEKHNESSSYLNSTLQHISSQLSTGITEYGPYGEPPGPRAVFDAPLFITWFCTAWTALFFPLYLMCRCCACKGHASVESSLKTVTTAFRDRGVTCSKLLSRCCLFSILWVSTNYMYIYSLRILDCTAVMTLYSVHVAFVYLLAWVILHEQFVGLRIVAVIMCSTGIALLVYMDGTTKSTRASVCLAALSAAGSAVYKVLFKKVVGDASFGQVSVFFTVIAILNTVLLGPVVAALHLAGYEIIVWSRLPWFHLLLAAALTLVANILGNFGVAITFETFITLGLVVAIPVSGILDVRRYGVQFEGMKLAGIILITIGFFLVLFPSDWPTYLTWFLRLGRHRRRQQQRQTSEPVDYRTGLISRSHLRSSSGHIR